MGCALLADDQHVVGCSEDGGCSGLQETSTLLAGNDAKHNGSSC
jgi:hypothetical protein